MRLSVSTPVESVLSIDGVASVRAEDATGLFALLPGHVDFLTVLAVSVLSWRDRDGQEQHVAVRGGVLTVRGGLEVAVATREAVPGEDLRVLEKDVLARFREEAAAESRARTEVARWQAAAVQRIARTLRPRFHPGGRAAPGEEEA